MRLLFLVVFLFGCTTTPNILEPVKTEPTVKRLVVWNKKQFLKPKGGVTMNAATMYGIQKALGGKNLKALPLINGFTVEVDQARSLSFTSDEWEVSPDITHYAYETLYRITPVESTQPACPQCPTCPNPSPNPTPTPAPISDTVPYGVAMVRAVEAQGIVDTSNVKLCVADTGTNLNHPDLKPAIIGGANFVGGTSYADDNAHGSHVAATALGVANNSGIVGVAGKAKLLTAKVLSSNGSGSGSGIANGIVWCANQGADVINLSLGSSQRDPVMDRAVAYAISKGVVVVVAAGNSGRPISGSPAQAPGVIVVTAVDRNGRPASFTSYGPEADFYAPGVDIVSASHTGSGTATMSGTSMSSPHVAGIALLMKAAGKTMIKARSLGLPTQYGQGLADAMETIK